MSTEIELFKVLIEKYGLLGVLLFLQIYLFVRDQIAVKKKKDNGTYVSWESMNEKIKELETGFKAHETMGITLHTEIKGSMIRVEESQKAAEKSIDKIITVLERLIGDVSFMKGKFEGRND